MDDRDIDVAVLALGIDADARERVQQAMNGIAERGDTSRPDGLVKMLGEAIDVLRGVEAHWTHAAADNAQPMPAEEAEAKFVEAAERARSRFDEEVIRNYAGTTIKRDLPELPPTEEPGVVVVTLVVAARRELADVSNATDRGQLEACLDALAGIDPGDFVALEVIWSPADERDRMSVEEIEKEYPELTRLSVAGTS